MNKEKIESLKKYVAVLKDKLDDAPSSKHINRVESYHNYLKNEIRIASSKIEEAKLEGAK